MKRTLPFLAVFLAPVLAGAQSPAPVDPSSAGAPPPPSLRVTVAPERGLPAPSELSLRGPEGERRCALPCVLPSAPARYSFRVERAAPARSFGVDFAVPPGTRAAELVLRGPDRYALATGSVLLSLGLAHLIVAVAMFGADAARPFSTFGPALSLFIGIPCSVLSPLFAIPGIVLLARSGASASLRQAEGPVQRAALAPASMLERTGLLAPLVQLAF